MLVGFAYFVAGFCCCLALVAGWSWCAAAKRADAEIEQLCRERERLDREREREQLLCPEE